MAKRKNNITFAQIEEIARDPDKCRALVEALRFPQGLICPFCSAREPGRTFVRHRTRLSLGQWIRAIWLIVSSSKGISSRKLSEMLGITYKVAWHLGHRIRSMMTNQDLVLSGVVEMDEIYAGAPPRKKHGGGPTGVKSGRGPRRPLILTIAERGGDAVFRQIPTHSTKAIVDASSGHVDPAAIISTDSLPAYRKAVAGHRHLTVKHSAHQYVVKDPAGIGVDAHTNTAEAIHSEIRRAVIGVWHWISQKHIGRYLDEISWRHNQRDRDHTDRIVAVFASKTSPLPYSQIVHGSP